MEKISRKKFVKGMLALLDKFPRSQVVEMMASEIVARGWGSEVDVLMREAAEEKLARDGHLEITVKTARPLPAAAQKRIRDLLADKAKAKTSSLHEEIVPELKGGVIAESPLGRMDLSQLSLLNQLRQK